MAAFTINIPIRTLDANDVKNAFASSYGYEDTVAIGGVTVLNPITREEFVKQKCINFMLDITRAYLIKVEEISAREAAQQAADDRATDVTQWFDGRRLESIGGISIFQNFPSVNALNITGFTTSTLATGAKIRLNFSAVNSTHANFSINLYY